MSGIHTSLAPRRQGRMRALAATAALFFRMRRKPLLGGIALAALTVLAGVALLGLSGWFITATAAAGSAAATALAFDVFRPAAGIRMLALLRTGGRYGERLVSHDATLGLLAELRERLFRAHAGADRARALKARPARLLHRLTVEVDALDTLYLRVLLPAAAAVITAALAALALSLIDTRLGVGVGVGVGVTGIALPLALARAADRPARRRAAALEALRMRTVDLVAGQTDHLMTGRIGAARDHAAAMVAAAGGRAVMVPAISPDIADGTATQSLEFLTAAPALDRLYVAVGMGSGICGAVRARDALGLETEIVGVVAEGAPAYALSFAAGRRIETAEATTFADGIACRSPDPWALEVIGRGVSRFVTVSEAGLAEAVRACHADTHNLAEGAGAAALAGAMADAAAGRLAGCRRIGVVLSGGNIDAALYAGLIAAPEAA